MSHQSGKRRASLILKQPLTELEQGNVPPPPPPETRPRNASLDNEEREEDARMLQVADRLRELQLDLDAVPAAAAAAATHVDDDSDIPPPPPDDDEAPPTPRKNRLDLKARLSVADGASAARPVSTRPTLERQSSQTGLPRHDVEFANRDLYRRLNLNGVTAERLASMMEATMMSNTSLTRAFTNWTPVKNDVVVCASPRCGQSLITKMIRLLGAKNEDEFLDICDDHSGTAPWVECRLTDENPNVLYNEQPGKYRIFRTAMTYAQLSVKVSRSGAKFVVVIRNPLDLRKAWAKYLRDFYIKNGPSNAGADFDARFTPDDFAMVPVTVVESTRRTNTEGEYEMAMCDWLKAQETLKDSVLVVFIEEAIAKPDVVLDKLATFLNVGDLDGDQRESILNVVSGPQGLKSVQRKNSMTFTPSQVKMLNIKFQHEPDETLLLQKMLMSEAISQRFGIFASDGCGDEADGISFSPLTMNNMEEVFNRCVTIPFLNDVIGDYKAVYSRVTGSPYPEPPVPLQRRETMTQKVRTSIYATATSTMSNVRGSMLSSSNLSDKGGNNNVRGSVLSSSSSLGDHSPNLATTTRRELAKFAEEDDANDEEEAKLRSAQAPLAKDPLDLASAEQPPARRTLVNRLFGSKKKT